MYKTQLILTSSCMTKAALLLQLERDIYTSVFGFLPDSASYDLLFIGYTPTNFFCFLTPQM